MIASDCERNVYTAQSVQVVFAAKISNEEKKFRTARNLSQTAGLSRLLVHLLNYLSLSVSYQDRNRCLALLSLSSAWWYVRNRMIVCDFDHRISDHELSENDASAVGWERERESAKIQKTLCEKNIFLRICTLAIYKMYVFFSHLYHIKFSRFIYTREKLVLFIICNIPVLFGIYYFTRVEMYIFSLLR